MNTETIRKVIAIPANNIKRMCCINNLMHHSFFFYLDKEISFFIVGFNFLRQFKITLAKRRMLQVLPAGILITLRCIEWRCRFYIEQPVILSLKIYLINHAPRDNKVISILKRNITHKSAKLAFTLVDKKHFISISILIKIFTQRFRSEERRVGKE